VGRCGGSEPGRAVDRQTWRHVKVAMMRNSAPAQVVLVTGCSSGIGKSICDLLGASGARTYGGSRTSCEPKSWTYLRLDVTDEASVRAAIQEVVRREGRLDTVITCAGLGLAGPLEATTDAEAQRHFDVNFFGTTRVIRCALPVMRAQRSGRIIVIGSIGGLIGLPFVAYYSAAKFALDGMVEALRTEIRPFGIQATIVHPGDLNTSFGANRIFARNIEALPAYADASRRALEHYQLQENGAPGPAGVARAVLGLMSRRSLPVRVIVGSPLEKLGVLGKRLLDSRSFEYALRKAYGPS
jgi:NAD(P)-dependent dehydrogenase (short-subunit alcohol dehydrogenase family)